MLERGWRWESLRARSPHTVERLLLQVTRGGDVVYGEDYRAALLWCWAALRRPLATATWWDTCQVWRVAWPAGSLGPWVAVVAIAPAAFMRSVACPPSPMSSTAMAQVALGGCLPLPGCRVAVTLMRTAFSGSG